MLLVDVLADEFVSGCSKHYLATLNEVYSVVSAVEMDFW